MPREFSCVECGSQVTTFMRLGEEVKCKNCGAIQMVPEHARDTSELHAKPGQDSFASSIKVAEEKSNSGPTGSQLSVTTAQTTNPRSPQPISSSTQHVIIDDISMSFGSMVVFMVKWAFAAIPAVLIIMLATGLIITIFSGLTCGALSAMN